jgi:exodeoxyribonuclease-3
MKIATWNVNGLRARFDFLRLWLERRAPDVVALQELKLDDEQFPRQELAALGYHAVTHGQKSWNGVAVLAREPVEAVDVGLPGREEDGARLVSARLGELVVCSVYCPNGKTLTHPDYATKLAWLDRLHGFLQERHDPAEPLIVCGDFNVCPEPIDSWDEERLNGAIFHTEEERSRFRKLLDWGLVDVFRRLRPDDQLFSWWDYRAGAFHMNQGLRIDLVLGTHQIAERANSATIDRDFRKKQDGLTASDHAPVIIELG